MFNRKFAILTVLSVQVSDIKYIHNVVQGSITTPLYMPAI